MKFETFSVQIMESQTERSQRGQYFSLKNIFMGIVLLTCVIIIIVGIFSIYGRSKFESQRLQCETTMPSITTTTAATTSASTNVGMITKATTMPTTSTPNWNPITKPPYAENQDAFAQKFKLYMKAL